MKHLQVWHLLQLGFVSQKYSSMRPVWWYSTLWPHMQKMLSPVHSKLLSLVISWSTYSYDIAAAVVAVVVIVIVWFFCPAWKYKSQITGLCLFWAYYRPTAAIVPPVLGPLGFLHYNSLEYAACNSSKTWCDYDMHQSYFQTVWTPYAVTVSLMVH